MVCEAGRKRTVLPEALSLRIRPNQKHQKKCDNTTSHNGFLLILQLKQNKETKQQQKQNPDSGFAGTERAPQSRHRAAHISSVCHSIREQKSPHTPHVCAPECLQDSCKRPER